jgi:sugar lactone lactonase YvrE
MRPIVHTHPEEQMTLRFDRSGVFGVVLACLILTGSATIAESAPESPALLVSGLAGASGSTVGPDGALYVTEGATGTITRIHPRSGATTTFASGLPPSLVGIGGAIDLAFVGKTAYVLVTLVGPDVGGNSVVGIYRVDGRHDFSVVADIGAWSIANPPGTPFDLPTGVQYAIDAYAGGFLVTDGHHNRVLRVTLDGQISEFATFGNIAPTGLAVQGPLVLMAQAGSVPHVAEDGKVLALSATLKTGFELASGGRLLVDVEFGCGDRIFALAQGEFQPGNPPGSPALPHTGSLLQMDASGGLRALLGEVNLPTSLEVIDDTAYVVSLPGDIWTFDLGRRCRRHDR